VHGCRVQGLWSRGLGFRVEGVGFRVWGAGVMLDEGFMVQGFRVSGSGLQVPG